MAPKQTDPQFKLRLTPELKDRIEAAALEMGRSMNAEILQRLEASFEEERDSEKGPDSTRLELENLKLKSRLDLWEPLILQATPEELERLRQRLVRFRAVLEGDDANEILKGIMLPVENLAEQFPSLTGLQRLFDKIRAADNPEKSGRAAPHWDWENAQTDPPPAIPKPTSGRAKRQKR